MTDTGQKRFLPKRIAGEDSIARHPRSLLLETDPPGLSRTLVSKTRLAASGQHRGKMSEF
jgi:hypothetical protein